MEIAHDMNDEAKRELLVRQASMRILKDSAIVVQRLKRVAFGRRVVVRAAR